MFSSQLLAFSSQSYLKMWYLVVPPEEGTVSALRCVHTPEPWPLLTGWDRLMTPSAEEVLLVNKLVQKSLRSTGWAFKYLVKSAPFIASLKSGMLIFQCVFVSPSLGKVFRINSSWNRHISKIYLFLHNYNSLDKVSQWCSRGTNSQQRYWRERGDLTFTDVNSWR